MKNFIIAFLLFNAPILSNKGIILRLFLFDNITVLISKFFGQDHYPVN